MADTLDMSDLPKLRRRGRPRKHPAPDPSAPRRRPGPQPNPAEKRTTRVAVSLPPDVLADLQGAWVDRMTEHRTGSRSRVVTMALREYFGRRADRNAEIVLNRFGQRAARVLSLYARDGIMAQVYRVLDDLAKAVGEDWQAADFEPAPDELTRLYAENRMMRDLIRQTWRTTDAEVEAWLNRRHMSAGPEDLRDGKIGRAPRYLRPVEEVEAEEDDGRNSLGLRMGGEPFMG